MHEQQMAFPPRVIDGGTIQRDFEAFHAANPHVYAELVRLARLYHARLGTYPGIGMLWEVARWNIALDTRTDAVWKLNNNYRSRYARLMMDNELDLHDAFETRRLKAA